MFVDLIIATMCGFMGGVFVWVTIEKQIAKIERRKV